MPARAAILPRRPPEKFGSTDGASGAADAAVLNAEGCGWSTIKSVFDPGWQGGRIEIDIGMATDSRSSLLAQYPVIAIHRFRSILVRTGAIGEIDAEIGARPELPCPETAPRYASVYNFVPGMLVVFALSPELKRWDRERG